MATLALGSDSSGARFNRKATRELGVTESACLRGKADPQTALMMWGTWLSFQRHLED